MWTGGPSLHVTVEVLQILHPFLAGYVVPIRQGWESRVVEHDELRPPRGEVEARDVLPELLRLQAETNDALPVRHCARPLRVLTERSRYSERSRQG